MVSARSGLRELEALLGADRVTATGAELGAAEVNTLGLVRSVAAVVRPESTEQVQRVIEIANRYRLPLHPVSRGRNIGYGDRTPVRDGLIVVDLSRMARIRSFDPDRGKVVVEPGVTQQQLYEFLGRRGAQFWMDVTGSTADSSIVGNTLDGGYGHTPVGNRRALLAGVEVVLGNGTVLEAGTFPDLGPDLNGAFVQSNLGIVTAIEVTLLPAPERYLSFMVRADSDSRLEELVDRVSLLRRDGTFTSLVHVANATRSLMSTLSLPEEFRNRLVSDEDAVALLSNPVAKAGYWTAIGGVYGSARQVAAKRADIRSAFRGLAAVQFFSDRKVRLLQRVFSSWPLRKAAWAEKPRRGIEALEYIHGLGRGTPSDRGVQGVLWRTERPEDAGFFWCSATFAGVGRVAAEAVRIASRLFAEYGFELPIVITFVSPDRAVATLSCNFNRNDPEQTARAHTLYFSLQQAFAKAGLGRYRSGILGMDQITYHDRGKRETLELLKGVLDPNRVIAPGRYGID